MTKDDIIAMAREAGFVYWEYFPVDYQNKLERFAALVAAREHESCSEMHDWVEEGEVLVQQIESGQGGFLPAIFFRLGRWWAERPRSQQ